MNNLNLEPQSMNSGIERAALMISEEKHQQDSRKNKKSPTIHFSISVIFVCLISKILSYWRIIISILVVFHCSMKSWRLKMCLKVSKNGWRCMPGEKVLHLQYQIFWFNFCMHFTLWNIVKDLATLVAFDLEFYGLILRIFQLLRTFMFEKLSTYNLWVESFRKLLSFSITLQIFQSFEDFSIYEYFNAQHNNHQ